MDSSDISPLQKKRLAYTPRIPESLKDLNHLVFEEAPSGRKPQEELRKLFPRTIDQSAFRLKKGRANGRALKVGVVFSGGQASGGHNVIAGLFDALKEIDPGSELVGFLGGPSGIVENAARTLGKREIDAVRNQGGFDLIGSGRTKIETAEQLASSLESCRSLDALVVIGGDDSNTNAAILAEYFLEKGCKAKVIGVPKTIDGDLRSEEIEISFGFDSACKTYAELIGNIARDALSAKKYYHFIKLMGRSASHIALECALAARPNLALIGEEGKGLYQIVGEIADLVCRRKEAGKEYGVVLIPEGLIEFMPEIRSLIGELNAQKLSEKGKALFSELPEAVQKQLTLEKDPHGNVQVSQIQTEVLLMEFVRRELKKRNFKGKFSAQEHFLGYEGRACMPSNFDANYCYALGRLAAVIARDGLTGMICSAQNLKQAAEEWEMKAVPIVQLMHFEVRKGKEKPVIRKALVDINQEPFVYFSRFRKNWEIEDCYRYPGPIQFFGDRELTDSVPLILKV